MQKHSRKARVSRNNPGRADSGPVVRWARRRGILLSIGTRLKSQLFTDGHDTVPYSGTVVYRCHIVKMGADGHVYRCCPSVSIGFVYRSNLSARVVSLGVLSRAPPVASAAAFVGLPRRTHLRARPREVAAAGMNAGRFGAALSGQRSDIFPPSFPQVLPTGKRLDGQECPTPGVGAPTMRLS